MPSLKVTIIYIELLNCGYPIPIQSIVTKYAQSNLSNIDISQLELRLKALMKEEKIFLETGLNLATLAKKLEISTHQLSEFLNQENQQIFNDYINSYRIEEAKNRLLNMEKSHLTIEAIAYDVGFNSSATFYRCFKKFIGSSPTVWVKEQAFSLKE